MRRANEIIATSLIETEAHFTSGRLDEPHIWSQPGMRNIFRDGGSQPIMTLTAQITEEIHWRIRYDD